MKPKWFVIVLGHKIVSHVKSDLYNVDIWLQLIGSDLLGKTHFLA